jgi:hypothetical protein
MLSGSGFPVPISHQSFFESWKTWKLFFLYWQRVVPVCKRYTIYEYGTVRRYVLLGEGILFFKRSRITAEWMCQSKESVVKVQHAPKWLIVAIYTRLRSPFRCTQSTHRLGGSSSSRIAGRRCCHFHFHFPAAAAADWLIDWFWHHVVSCPKKGRYG